MGQLLHLVINQRNVRRVHGDVAAHAAHGNAHIRLFQGRGIVDAVADHAHGQALRLVFSDIFQLVLRQAVGPDFCDMQLAGNGPGGVFMVAGEQDRLDAQTAQSGNRSGAFCPQGIGQGDKSGKCAVNRHIGDRTPLLQGSFRVPGHSKSHALLPQQLRISGQHRFPFDFGADAPAGDHSEILSRPEFRAGLLTAANNGSTQRMLGELFGGGRKPVKRILGKRL